MTNYEEQYYIVLDAYNINSVYLTATEQSAARDYNESKVDDGEGPLTFKSRLGKNRDTSILDSLLGDAHMVASKLAVSEALYNELKIFLITTEPQLS